MVHGPLLFVRMHPRPRTSAPVLRGRLGCWRRIEEIHAECVAATPQIQVARQRAAVGGPEGMGVGQTKGTAMRNEITFLPKFAQYLGHPLVLGVARAMLDTHVR